MTRSTHPNSIFLSAAALVLLVVAPAHAVSFTVDPTRSSIKISGTAAGSTITEQGPGSLTTTYAGTIEAEISAATIRFPAGSQVIAQNNGSWQPKSDASAGSEAASYGAVATPLFSLAKAALRNLQVDVFSPELSLTSGQFDSRSLTFMFRTNAHSLISYVVTGLLNMSGSNYLAGYATNTITTQASISTVGETQTLTLPVDATFYITLATTNDSTIRLQGQIVATRSTQAPPQIQSIGVQNQTVTLYWQAPTGQVFKVFASGNLQTWDNVAPGVTSSSDAYTYSEPATNTTRFFRIAR